MGDLKDEVESLWHVLNSITKVRAHFPGRAGMNPTGPATLRPARSLLGQSPELPLCTRKVAQADAVCPELLHSSSLEGEEGQGRLRRPPCTVSLHSGLSPPQASSPATLDCALQAVQAAIERRQRLEQVGGHSAPQGTRGTAVPWSPPGTKP